MIDISFVGGKIVLKSGSTTCTISDFVADENPIEYESLEVASGEVNLNGTAIFWRKPSLINTTVAVLAGSQSHEKLLRFLKMSHIENGSAAPISDITVDSITIYCPAINKSGNGGSTWSQTFTNGRLISGDPGPSVNSEGKILAAKFTFAFESMSAPSLSGLANF